MPTPMPKIDRAEAAMLYAEGATTVGLAARYGASPQAVNRALRAVGVTMRPPHRGSVRRHGEAVSKQIASLYRDGLTRQEIVVRTGISRETVLRRLHEAGIDLRAKGTLPASIRIPDDQAKLGYLAGLLDGEGHVHVRQRDGRSVSGKVAIYSTTRGVMEWLSENIGGTVRWDEKRREKGWLPIGIWEVYRARDVALLLSAVEPLLIVKRAVAGEVLAHLAHRGISAH